MAATANRLDTQVRALIVDDDPAWRHYLAAVLAASGDVHVDSVATAREATAAMRAHHYDLSLIDYCLEEGDGLSVVREGLALGTAGTAIVVSGRDLDALRAEAHASGAAAVMTKGSFDEDVIRLLIRQAAATRDKFAPETRLRAFFDAGVVGIVFGDANGRLIDANDKFLEIIGASRRQLREGTLWWHPLEPATYSERVIASAEQFRRLGYCEPFEARYRRADGGNLWLLVGIASLASTTMEGMAFVLDVTAERERRQTLIESQRKFSTVFACSPSPMAIFETGTGIIVDVNPGFAQLAGIPADRLLRQDARALALWDSIDQRAVVARMVRGETVVNVPMQVRNASGEVRHALIAAERVSDPDSARQLAVCIAIDVTENRQLDQQFRQAQKMEAIGQLAGGIAHDFNNLLTVINGYGELLEGRDLPPDVRADVDAILHAGKSAATLTRQLLAFSRRAMLEPRPTDLNQWLRHLNSILRRLIGEDISLDFVLAENVPRVMADPHQLDQVIINLAVNARDAMPLGGRLTIETGTVDLDDTYVAGHPGSRPGRHAMIAVTDTGVGMDDTVKRHLFEPFFTTKERGHGTGLGLAMVYGTVKQSGGSIWVYSERGLGTTFKIYLPATALDERPEIKRPRDASIGGTETILLVEDQDDVRRLARQVLERQGYTVIDVANPRDTFKLDLPASQQVDLMLTDVVMPHISGRQLARVWQARYPRLRVLYMSGYTADTIVKHGVLEDGLAFIAKPFSGTALLEKVREVLDSGDPPPA